MTAISNWLNQGATLMIALVALPILAGLVVWLLKRRYAIQLTAALVFGAVNALFCLALYLGGGADAGFAFAGLAIAPPTCWTLRGRWRRGDLIFRHSPSSRTTCWPPRCKPSTA